MSKSYLGKVQKAKAVCSGQAKESLVLKTHLYMHREKGIDPVNVGLAPAPGAVKENTAINQLDITVLLI